MSSKQSSFPTGEHVPNLDINFEGLRRHSFMLIFSPEPELATSDRKLRTWLLHTLVTACRHYQEARTLVVKQDNHDQMRDGGAIFYVLDVAENLEHCVSATFRALSAVRRIAKRRQQATCFLDREQKSIAKLTELRNQFEHMHTQIVSDEAGNGPISMSFAEDGRKILFRKKSLRTASLRELLRGLYFEIGAMHPKFDVHSSPERGGPSKLTMTATVQVIDKDEKKQS